MRRSLPAKAVIYILLAFAAALSLLPMLWAIASSFSTDESIYRYASPLSWKAFFPLDFNLKSYVGLFTQFQFGVPIWNTLVVSFWSILLGCLVNSVAAFGFAVFDFKFKKLLYAIVLLSFMVPFEAIAMPLYRIVDAFGWVDTRMGIVVPTLADGLVLMLFTQFFKDVPPAILEAARIDGASYRQIFTRIILPLSVPIFITAGLMIFMFSWNAFLWPLIIARTPTSRVIQVSLTAFQTERATLWSYLFAASCLSAFIPLILFLPFQKYYVEGITASGIKG